MGRETLAGREAVGEAGSDAGRKELGTREGRGWQ